MTETNSPRAREKNLRFEELNKVCEERGIRVKLVEAPSMGVDGLILIFSPTDKILIVSRDITRKQIFNLIEYVKLM